MDATELVASPVDLTNTLVAGAGCHSGYNIVDEDAVPGVTVPLDWVEAFARKGATLVAGTGYQYGDTDFLEYSERLYANFTERLRMGSGAVPVGAALVKAKQDYLAGTPSMRGIHSKALLQATLYGLPMLSYNLPSGRIPEPTTSSIVGSTSPVRGVGNVLGLRYADVALTPTTDPSSKTLTNLDGGTTDATWWTGPNGVLTSPGEPALPLARYDVSVPGRVARGVGFRGATFVTPLRTGVTPLTGAATTETHAVHTPFAPSVWFPLRLWSLNYFGALSGSGGATTLNVTPAQYKADGPGSITSTVRRYTAMDLRVYYSAERASYATGPSTPPNTPALTVPPSIAAVESTVAGTDIHFRTRVVGDPSAGVQEAWITYFGVHDGRWESVDLRQDSVDSTLWTGTLTLPAGVNAGDVRYIVQAVNGVGLASLDDNFGTYYAPAGQDAVTPRGTTLALVTAPTRGVYRSSANVAAELRDEYGTPVAGQPVAFSVGNATRVATTNATGRATTSVPLTDRPGSYRLTAAFGGGSAHTASSDSREGFTLAPLPAALTLTAGPTATLTAGGAPLISQTVLLVLKRADGSIAAAFSRITDGQGRARLTAADIPAGELTLTAHYGGSVLLATGPVTLGDPTPYAAATATMSLCVSGCPTGVVLPGVPTLGLTLGARADFGALRPGRARDYAASMAVSVSSPAEHTALTIVDPSAVAPGRLVNGRSSLPQPLRAGVAGALAPLGSAPTGLKAWTAPIFTETVLVDFRQAIGARDVLRTGAYSKPLTFTLAATTP